MGCDIIAHIEYSRNGKDWEVDRARPYEKEYNSLAIGRHYDLFGIMAGMRGQPARKMTGMEKATWRLAGATPSAVGQTRGLPADSIVPGWTDDDDPPPSSIEKFNQEEHYGSWGNLVDLKLWLYLWKTQFYPRWRAYKNNPSARWTQIVKRMETLEKRGLKTRFVFWFSY